MSRPALSLWKGKTVHVRYAPFKRRFSYELVLIDLDIDRLSEAAACSSCFSINAPNLYSFYEKDHGPKLETGSLRPWAEDTLAKVGVLLDGGAIRLVTFPRHWLYKFAPISLWYGYGPEGELRGIIYEVNNTFGETHSYVSAVTGERSQHSAPKSFHVSPFFDVSGTYRFTLRLPSDKLSVMVESMRNAQSLHLASITARRLNASGPNFLRLALTNPLSTIGVTIGIHWQALKLWLHGAAYRRKPPPPQSGATIARADAEPHTCTRKNAA